MELIYCLTLSQISCGYHLYLHRIIHTIYIHICSNITDPANAIAYEQTFIFVNLFIL